jgi:hypothetical protein
MGTVPVPVAASFCPVAGQAYTGTDRRRLPKGGAVKLTPTEMSAVMAINLDRSIECLRVAREVLITSQNFCHEVDVCLRDAKFRVDRVVEWGTAIRESEQDDAELVASTEQSLGQDRVAL